MVQPFVCYLFFWYEQQLFILSDLFFVFCVLFFVLLFCVLFLCFVFVFCKKAILERIATGQVQGKETSRKSVTFYPPHVQSPTDNN